MSLTIIGLSGVARSGKDTVANILVNDYGFTRYAFADKLKEAAYALDPIIVQNGSTTRLTTLVDHYGWESAKGNPEVRRTLQRMGSEAGWHIHGRHLWTSALERELDLAPQQDRIVISDVRFPHEVEWITNFAYQSTMIHVTRSGIGRQLYGDNARHDSEQYIPEDAHHIDNNGSLDDLHAKVTAWADKTMRINA